MLRHPAGLGSRGHTAEEKWRRAFISLKNGLLLHLPLTWAALGLARTWNPHFALSTHPGLLNSNTGHTRKSLRACVLTLKAASPWGTDTCGCSSNNCKHDRIPAPAGLQQQTSLLPIRAHGLCSASTPCLLCDQPEPIVPALLTHRGSSNNAEPRRGRSRTPAGTR